MRKAEMGPSQVGERLKGTGGPQSPEWATVRESPHHRHPEACGQAGIDCCFGAISRDSVPSAPGKHTFWVAGMAIV